MNETGNFPKKREYGKDALLRISDAQVWGTHNSYHVAPENNSIALWDYTHLPLDMQLDNGIRQFELDIVYDPEADEVLVQHVPFLDVGSTCFLLVDCLEILRTWSREHPWHFPLQIFIEPKDEVAAWSVENHFEMVEQQIVAHWGDHIWTPQDQIGNHSSLRASIVSQGWATLEQARGHAIFVLFDKGTPRDVYTENLTRLSDRILFPLVPPEHAFASYLIRDDPFEADIPSLVAQGFLIRTRGDRDLIFDPHRLDQAQRVGAHAISVDTIQSLEAIEQGLHIRCNPLSSSDCNNEDLE